MQMQCSEAVWKLVLDAHLHCVYPGSLRYRMGDCTVKGGKQVRYIPAKIRVPYLHHAKEHGKLCIVH